MNRISIILATVCISLPAFALGLTACDVANLDDDLAAEVDRLQAENDALRAAVGSGTC